MCLWKTNRFRWVYRSCTKRSCKHSLTHLAKHSSFWFTNAFEIVSCRSAWARVREFQYDLWRSRVMRFARVSNLLCRAELVVFLVGAMIVGNTHRMRGAIERARPFSLWVKYCSSINDLSSSHRWFGTSNTCMPLRLGIWQRNCVPSNTKSGRRTRWTRSTWLRSMHFVQNTRKRLKSVFQLALSECWRELTVAKQPSGNNATVRLLSGWANNIHIANNYTETSNTREERNMRIWYAIVW